MGKFCTFVCLSRILAAIYQWSYELQVLPYKNSRTAERIFIKFGTEAYQKKIVIKKCVFWSIDCIFKAFRPK
jgi:hypothetical protein